MNEKSWTLHKPQQYLPDEPSEVSSNFHVADWENTLSGNLLHFDNVYLASSG
jgi:hypothetical protein